MKNTFAILTILVLISSCIDKNDKESARATKEGKQRQNVSESYAYRDSVYALNVWDLCQRLIESNKHTDYFVGNTDTTHFENNGNSELYGVVEITSAFNPSRKIARVKRISTGGFTYVDIVDLTTDSILIREKLWWGNFVDDTILDVNVDGFSDYVLKGMASSGCCPREESWIYLYNPNTNSFEKPIDILNAHYCLEDKELYGMSYGHPKETYLYKIKLNNVKADTIAFLHNHPEDSTKFVLTKTIQVDLKTDEVLNEVPKEYKKAEANYLWFIGR